MINHRIFMPVLSLAITIYGAAVYAQTPQIYLHFSDPQGVCRNEQGQTQLQFTYKYTANQDLQYFSHIISVSQANQTIIVPTPIEQGYTPPYTYTDFEISSQGPCGNKDLDYSHYGPCHLNNLIPSDSQNAPHSYKITLIPQVTGKEPWGGESYNFTCKVEKIT